MALYRYNLRLSQEMFTIVSCFEVALRNAIDSLLVPSLGEDWLKDSVQESYIINEYQKIQTLFSWMGIDSRSMLYGLDHVQSVCAKINSLKG